MGVPPNGWFIWENQSINGWFGSAPILGNPHVTLKFENQSVVHACFRTHCPTSLLSGFSPYTTWIASMFTWKKLKNSPWNISRGWTESPPCGGLPRLPRPPRLGGFLFFFFTRNAQIVGSICNSISFNLMISKLMFFFWTVSLEGAFLVTTAAIISLIIGIFGYIWPNCWAFFQVPESSKLLFERMSEGLYYPSA